jgi:pyruvate dehydrogenase E2 component (dihydrolipoamide acetyltransferase)
VARAIVMPSMGMYTEEGVLTAWLRPAGARVATGEPVAEITTEKATFEIPAPEEGTLHPVAAIGTTLKVEVLMGYILREGETAPARMAMNPATSNQRSAATDVSIPVLKASSTVGSLRASPIAKRLAAQHGIDLEKLTGSGPGGRIVEADIRAALVKRSSAGETSFADYRIAERLPIAGLRSSLAERLRTSLATAASTTLTREVSADVLVDVRQKLAAKRGQAPSYDALFTKIFAAALRERPELNAVLENDTIVRFQEINIGFAVAVPNGLVVPVIRNADSAPLGDIAKAVKDLTDRVLAGRLQPGDLEGGTATISNLGNYGIDAFTPILNGPQSAILGIGRIAPRPVVCNHELAIGYTCILSLTFDHRVTDGAPAALLLDAVARRMNDQQFFVS